MANQSPARPLFFYLNHPAHYHLFKNAINQLIREGFSVKVGIVKKDVLEDLVKQENWDYVNLFPEGRRYKGLGILVTAVINLFKGELRLYRFARKINASMIIGSEGTLAHAGFFCGVPSLLFNEDDSSATGWNWLFYPFATKVILPTCCDRGKWNLKKVNYNGYHELAYLHPRFFTPDEHVVKSLGLLPGPYFILRLAELTAHHDKGKTGITDTIALQIINKLKQQGRVLITSERPLKPEFEPYRLNIHPKDIFHVLAFADLYIGDSQTMAAEAAVLGTPAIRFNDFVGKLGYLEELEHLYQLTFGIKTTDADKMFEKINEILAMPHRKSHWQNKRKVMLVEKMDVVDFMVETIKAYLPKS
ncbi:MAG: DUF354 domain-containing protein [Candidatus Omnitrophica bacterium]|nr:DUF354 domain-containing protein [Candidatus Omnitrophota bacterium]